MSSGNRRRPLLAVLAIVVMALGLIGGVAIWLAADQRLDDAVAGFARAPVGCDTVLDFDTEGTYLLFVETSGQLDDVQGDCDVDTEITWTDDELPAVTLTLVGSDGDEVTLESDTGVDYDTATATGTSVQSAQIDVPGDHTLRVESADSGFAIAVGRDPNRGVLAMRLLAVGVALTGIVIGIALLSANRRRHLAPATEESPWAPQAGTPSDWPMSPPGFPAPPPTTGTTAVVGTPSGPAIRPSSGPLPTPPSNDSSHTGPGRPSVAPIPGQPGPWGPPPAAGDRPGG
jgi:hypothetical protein